MPPPAATASDDEDAAFEDRIKKATQVKGKGFGSQPAQEEKTSPLDSKPISSEMKAVPKAAEDSILGAYEGYYNGFLGFFGVFILAEGIFLAASGFLPQELDDFALRIVFPAFSPS